MTWPGESSIHETSQEIPYSDLGSAGGAFFFGMFFLGEIRWNTWHKGREGKTKAFCWGQNGHLRWHLKKIIVARLDWCWSQAKLFTLSCSSDQAAAAFAVWPNLLMAPWWNRQQMFYEQSLDCRDFHCEISIFTRLLFGCVLEGHIFSRNHRKPFQSQPPFLRALAKGKGFSKGSSFPPGPQGVADFSLL